MKIFEWFMEPGRRFDRIAIAASIVLSFFAIFVQPQFRISTLWDKPEIETTLASEIWLDHRYGKLNLGGFIQIKNIGKAKESISKVYIYLQKSDNNKSRRFEKLLKLQGAYDLYALNAKPGSAFVLPILGILLYPDEHYYNMVVSYETLEGDERKAIDEMENAIYEDIKTQVNSGIEYPIINDNLKQKVESFINENIKDFTVGDYSLLVIPFDKNNNPIMPNRYYVFTVFERDILKLQEITDDYYFGANDIYYSARHISVVKTINIKEHKEIIKDLMLESKKYW